MMRKLGVSIVGVIALLLGVVAQATSAPPGAAPGKRYTAEPVTNPNNPNQVSRKLVREKTPGAVVRHHIRALNRCNWMGLMQQYPDQYELRLPGGTNVLGREEAGAIFAGFVKPHTEGGLCGVKFREISRDRVGGTLSVTWEADAPFLRKPYRGSDAYITDKGLLVSMVSTFDGADLKFKR